MNDVTKFETAEQRHERYLQEEKERKTLEDQQTLRSLGAVEDCLDTAESEPVRYLVEGIIPRRAVVMVVGPPKSRKTYLVLDWAACVSHGMPWANRRTERCPVVLFDLDAGATAQKRRVRQIRRGRGIDGKGIFRVSGTRYDLSDKDGRANITKIISVTGAGLVVIDSFAAATGGLNEDKKHEVQPVFRWARAVVERLDCSVVFVHHENKSGAYRGSTSIPAGLDVLISVSSRKDSPVIRVRFDGVHDGPTPQPFSVRADHGNDSFLISAVQGAIGDDHTVVRFQSASYRTLVECLHRLGEATVDELAAGMTARKDAIKKMLQRLQTEGVVHRTDDGSRGQRARYALANTEAVN